MKQLVVVVEDRVGLLADVCSILAKQGMNIGSISVDVKAGKAFIRLVVENPFKASKLFKDAGYPVEVQEVVTVTVPNRPGQMAELSRVLAEKGANIENLFVVHQDEHETQFVIRVQPA